MLIMGVGSAIKKVKGALARMIFMVHGIITVWKVNNIYTRTEPITLPWIPVAVSTAPPTFQAPIYWLLAIPILLLPVEFVITTKWRKTGEWKWWCPSVFLYLASVVPGLWLLQFHLYRVRIETRNLLGWEDCQLEATNYSVRSLSNIQGIQTGINIALSENDWTLALEQILVIVLILGRWLLPKGSLTRDQLSQLLLAYIGMAADILEFNVENLAEQAVLCNRTLIITNLILWSWSLVQFTLVLTSTVKGRGKNFSLSRPKRVSELFCLCGCFTNEIWALLTTLLMQDVPFAAMRLYLIFGRRAIHQTMIFFTLKNLMVIALQLYRVGIVSCGDTLIKDDKPEQEKDRKVLVEIEDDRIDPMKVL